MCNNKEIQDLVKNIIFATETMRVLYARLIFCINGYILYFLLLLTSSIILYIKEDDKIIYYVSINSILFISFLLFIQYKNIRKYKQQYISVFNRGFDDWCQLSDKLDWSPLRRKILYNSDIKESKYIFEVMDQFYLEFQKRFSPVRTRFNFFRLSNLLFLLLNLIIMLMIVLYFVLNLTKIL